MSDNPREGGKEVSSTGWTARVPAGRAGREPEVNNNTRFRQKVKKVVLSRVPGPGPGPTSSGSESAKVVIPGHSWQESGLFLAGNHRSGPLLGFPTDNRGSFCHFCRLYARIPTFTPLSVTFARILP